MTYTDLRRQVNAAGLLDRTGWNSLPIALVTIALGAVGISIAVLCSDLWHLLAAPLLALFWMQLGFLGHDSGHNQVFARTEHNRRLGLVCLPFVLGISFRPWVIKHNLHHAETNVIDADPDIDHPLLAFTEEAALQRHGLAKWIVRYQAYAYPVMALFATLGFRIDAWLYALGLTRRGQMSDKYDGERRLELLLLAVNAFIWILLPCILLGAGRWLPVFVIGQMLLGLNMAFVFAPNHKGMPTFVDASHLTFAEQQVLTSRNVRGSLIVDFLFGGLNYQVEHHLFPTMPRRNLGHCRVLVRAFCHSTELAYTEESLFESLRSLFRSLDDVGKTVFLPRSTVALAPVLTTVAASVDQTD